MRLIMVSVFLVTLAVSAWSDRNVVARAEKMSGPAWGQMVSVNPDMTGYR